MTSRRAGAADAAGVAAGMSQGFESYRSFAPAAWEPPPRAALEGELRRLLATPGYWCLLAKDDAGALAGHVALLPAAEARSPVEDPRLGHLRQLFVAPARWGTGLAGELHDAMLAEAAARGFAELRLFTLAIHARARRFYAREGWAPNEGVPGPPLGGLEVVELRRPVGS